MIKHSLFGGLIQLKKRDKRNYRWSILGLSVFSCHMGQQKLFGLTIHKHDSVRKWLDEMQSHIDKKYDDIYILRHNIGESYVELMHLGDTLEANKSTNPLLILWDKKYTGFYKMFLPKGMDIQYVDLQQADIHSAFDREAIVRHNGQRFICSTQRIAQNMKKQMATKPDVNFYDYINNAAGIEKGKPSTLPKPSIEATQRVIFKIKRMELSDKFIILCPEATSLVELKNEFWEKLAEGLRDKGYDIFVNAHDHDTILQNAKSARMTIEELFILAQHSQGIISLASGLPVFLTAAGVKMDLLYTNFVGRKLGYNSKLAMQIYSVYHLPGVSKELVKEYDTAKLKGQNLIETLLQRY